MVVSNQIKYIYNANTAFASAELATEYGGYTDVNCEGLTRDSNVILTLTCVCGSVGWRYITGLCIFPLYFAIRLEGLRLEMEKKKEKDPCL